MREQRGKEGNEKLIAIKKRQKRRRWISFIILILSFLFVFNIGSIIGGIRGVLHLGHVNIKPIANLSYSSGVKINEGDVVQLAGDKLIKAEGGKLQYLDKEGILLWEKPYTGSKVIVKTAGKVIYIVEKDSGDFYVLDQQGGIQVKKEALGKVESVIAEDDEIAVLYKQLERKITVLGSDGSIKSEIDLPYPDILDIAYVPQSKLIAVSVFFVEKETFHSNVLLFGLDGKMKGARNFDNQILFRLAGVNDHIVGIGDSLSIAFNAEKDEIWKVPFDRTLTKLDISKDGYSAYNLIIENRDIADTREENVILLVSPEGKTLFEVKTNVVVESLKVRKDRVAIIGDGKVTLLDQNGRTLGMHNVSGNLKEVIWINQELLGLEYEDHFEIMSCKY